MPAFKAFLAQALETEYRGALPAWHRGPHQTGPLPVDQDPRAVRLRVPAQPRSQAGARAGGLELRRARAHNVVLLGPPGVGKTHLAIALAMKAVEAGYSALFLTLEQLMTRFTRTRHENRLERTL